MPDLPISGLPAASTPLSGSELVVVVQIGTTCQTPVSSLSLIGPPGPPGPAGPTGPPGPGIDTGMSYNFTAPQTVTSYGLTVQICSNEIYGVQTQPGALIASVITGGFAAMHADNNLASPAIVAKPDPSFGYAAGGFYSPDSNYVATLGNSGASAAALSSPSANIIICDSTDAIAVGMGTCAFQTIRQGVWQGTPIAPSYGGSLPSSSVDLQAAIAAVPSLLTVTAPNDGNSHQYLVGGYLNVTANGGTQSVLLSVTWTDENGNIQTFGVSLGPPGLVQFAPGADITISVSPNTIITLATTLPGTGSVTYDVGGFIGQRS
jgi:hypothetical protein